MQDHSELEPEPSVLYWLEYLFLISENCTVILRLQSIIHVISCTVSHVQRFQSANMDRILAMLAYESKSHLKSLESWGLISLGIVRKASLDKFSCTHLKNGCAHFYHWKQNRNPAPSRHLRKPLKTGGSFQAATPGARSKRRLPQQEE